ncbi:VOC family protein [Terriglobus albidus]|uniref:VOC family protein n=1 Tax=Terriglobus albidus TaxID=1592106 RepID=A0A5B9E9K0_9BACT|nr:VOC family protein [Terriglobus albidus]QEE26977.1 VOC family protein [Terriglobus albidus]
MTVTAESSSQLHLNDIAQVALTVQDLPRALTFYRDVLGMQFLFEAGNMAFFQCGSVRLMIGASDKPAGGGTTVYFRVADIQAVAAFLKGQGIALVQEPHLVARMKSHDLWLAFVNDPDGNTLGVMSEVARD